MISTKWLKKRRDYWTRLQQLLDQSDRNGLKSFDRSGLRELSLLYRQTAGDLSTLRQDASGKSYESYVHQLLRRAHNLIYAAEKAPRGTFLRFFTHVYPEVFLRNVPLVAGTLVLFLAAGLLGSLLTFADPDFAVQVVGPEMMQTIQRHEMWTHSVLSIKPAASSMIMTNNISVGFAMFAGGILAGIGTVWLTFWNGILMGVIGTACWMHGMSLQLWSFVAPHGVIELPCIFIAAASGLRLAQGLLFPGYLSRRESLARSGAGAVKLLLGTVPLLVIAGLIEGFVSPGPMHPSMKFALAAGLFLLLMTYLFSAAFRKEKKSEQVAFAD
jgi:uncharacterized membrane protein SpoIIM required for sporulation